MDMVTRELLKKLIEHRGNLCASVYMPTYVTGRETQQNLIRFKNLMGQVEDKLITRGIGKREIENLMEPFHDLAHDGLFWQYQSSGLALFRSVDTFSTYRLPLSFSELVVVNDTFNVKPLIPLLNSGGRFYVLAVSQSGARLFQGSTSRLDEVKVKDLPEGIGEALKYDDAEKQLQFHTGTVQSRGRRAALYHGHGKGIDNAKTGILRYFRKIDRALGVLPREEKIPLVLAGVDYLFPIYREANTYPYLLDKGIPGNPEGMKQDELHEASLDVVRPYFEKEQDDAMVLYVKKANTPRTSANLEEVIRAAYRGRVDLLFVVVGVQVWGTFDEKTMKAYLHEDRETGDEDLLNFAAVHTLSNGGTVFSVPHERVPHRKHAAAIFRY